MIGMILIALTPKMDVLQQIVWRYKSIYRRKKRLMRVIMEAAGPGLKRATAGRAADLVIHFGVPWQRIQELLDLQKELRSVTTLDVRAEKIFEAGLRRLGKRYGIARRTGETLPYWKLGGSNGID